MYIYIHTYQDLDNLVTIGDIIKKLEPDFDFSPVIREWAQSIPNELDFETEKSVSQQNVPTPLYHTCPKFIAAARC